jgi:ATP-dependent RNA/DNA helicase IGHMBP2
MCWIPLCRANRVVMAGDHFQLPPTVKSIKAESLKQTLFEKCIEHQPQSAVMLNTQYRMHEDIMSFSNKEFYKGELCAAEEVKNRLLSYNPEDSLLNTPIEFIDSAGCGFSEEFNEDTQSILNEGEAKLLFIHLELLLNQYYSGERKGKPSIGIIAPYSKQVQYLKDLLLERPEISNYGSHISIKTIDGFQGQEKDIIYISLVRSNEIGEIGFLKDIRRMNVALTRAKKKLVVIGDSATLANHSFYKDFLDFIDSKGAYKSAWEFKEL